MKNRRFTIKFWWLILKPWKDYAYPQKRRQGWHAKYFRFVGWIDLNLGTVGHISTDRKSKNSRGVIPVLRSRPSLCVATALGQGNLLLRLRIRTSWSRSLKETDHADPKSLKFADSNNFYNVNNGPETGPAMAFILDGNSEIDAHVRSDLCYFICLRHLIRSRVIWKDLFSFIY